MALLAQADAGTMYSCSSGTCTIPTINATVIGYYKNADTTVPYIECYQDSATSTFKCKAIDNPTTASCGDTTAGQLIKDGKFCLKGTISALFETTADSRKMYQVSYSADSIFSSTVNEEGKYGIVEISTNSIKLINTALTNKACVSTSTFEITDTATCTDGTEECKKFTDSANTCYYDCVISSGKNCNIKKNF